jgi:hypothetical protein
MSTSSESRTRQFIGIWWPALVGFVVFVTLAILGAALSPSDSMPADSWQVLMALFAGAPAAIIGTIWSAVRMRRKALKQLDDMTIDAFLDDTELLGAAICGHCPRYHSGRFVWTVGGVLAVTESELIFRTGPGQFKKYEIRIALHDLTAVEPCKVSFSPCGLCVQWGEDKIEFFLFNLFSGHRQISELIDVIYAAREQFGE